MKWNYLLPRLALAAIIWCFFAFAFGVVFLTGFLITFSAMVSPASILAINILKIENCGYDFDKK